MLLKFTLSLLLSLSLFVVADVTINNDITITSAIREIDIKKHVEETIVQYKVENSGSKAIDYFLHAVSGDKASHLAFIQAALSDGTPIDIQQVTLNPSPSPGSSFFKVTFPTPLAPKESFSVGVLEVFTGVLTPWPAEITQNEPQLLKFNDNVMIWSPYSITTQQTKVTVGYPRVLEHSPEQARVEGDVVELGPFHNTAPFTVEPLYLHFENNVPFITFETGVKEVEVSHWGNVAIEEKYLLCHKGAKLRGSFSRLDYQRSKGAQGAGASFTHIYGLLPESATGLYYRDRIGNISSSHARVMEDGVFVELLPRFPLFGGWKTDFYWGYNLPASDLIVVDADSGKYMLNVSFGSPFAQANVEQWEVRVILPEGASDIEWATPFEVDSEERSIRLTYLDTTGRPVLILRKSNVVRHHNQPLLVSYRFNNSLMIREPLYLTVFFLALFSFALVLQRMRLTISPPRARASAIVRRTGRLGELLQQVVALDTKIRYQYRRGNLAEADSNLVALKSVLAALRRESGLAELAGRIETCHAKLRGLAKAKGKDEARAATLEELDDLIRELSRK